MEALIKHLETMTLGQISGNVVLILIIFSVFFEVVPVQIHPLTTMLRWLGAKLNGEVLEKVDKLEKDFQKLSDTADERAAKDSRIRILRFGDEILHGQEHSKEHFDQILRDITEYEQYCHDNPDFKNNMTQITTKKILETYQSVWDKRTFL